ncbi:MAG: ribonuclease III [Alphaproteobacteria bacterium]
MEKNQKPNAPRLPPHLADESDLSLPYTFADKALLRDALTHPSVSADEDEYGRTRGVRYQRLEFLGDRVLGLEISHHLFLQFPQEDEGKLSRRLHSLVSQPTLAKIARRLKLDQHLVHSLCDATVSESVLSDCFEALIGAVYLDGGQESVRNFIRAAMREELENPPNIPPLDPKTRLQEWGLKLRHGLPKYRVIGHEGPNHAPNFLVSVSFPETDLPTAEGSGPSHRLAERAAAAALWAQIHQKGHD